MKQLALIVFILSISFPGLADEFRRKISLDWEPIPDAKYYDVEIKSASSDSKEKPKMVMVENATWSGRLTLGGYTLRVRGRDKRKVPGDWSEAQEFFVGLETPEIKSPAAQAKILSNSEDETKVKFEWKEVPGAKAYLFELTSKDGKVTKEKNTSDNSYSMSLPVAMEYTWKVSALGPKGINSNSKASADFSLWAKKLEKPKIVEPKNGFVREIDWDRPAFAENFDYVVSRYDDVNKKWVNLEKSNTPNQQAPFAQKLPGGKYRIAMKANANFRQSSGVAEKTFDVVNGNRSPAAEEIATVRESIDHTVGWFGIGSYLISFVDYDGKSSDKSSTTLAPVFKNAVSGTGRLGLGFLSPKTKWGFLGILDGSGIVLERQNNTYMSFEADGIHRFNLSDRSEIRQQFGLFGKEFPFIFSDDTGTQKTFSKAMALGPHYGAEYWQAISAKLGFQLNVHGYLNAVSVSTPNGGSSLNSDFSYQVGFLGSYRLSRNATGLAGLARRNDSVSYQGKTGINSATITGTYLNFFLEWQL